MTSMVAPATDNRDDETADAPDTYLVKVPRAIFDAIDVPPWATRRNISTRDYNDDDPDAVELFGWFCHDIAVPGGGTLSLGQYVYAETKSADVEVHAASIHTRSIDAMTDPTTDEDVLPSAAFAGLGQAFSRAASLAVVADLWARTLPLLDQPEPVDVLADVEPGVFPCSPCPGGCKAKNHAVEESLVGLPDIVVHDGPSFGDLFYGWHEESADRPGELVRHVAARDDHDSPALSAGDLGAHMAHLADAIDWLNGSGE